MSWFYFQEQWSLQHKCVFDGINRTIKISPNVSEINVKQDIYSDWKEWVKTELNSKFFPALRTIGGDPLGGGQYAGDMYFLINDWRVIIDHPVKINGILYSDDFPTPYIVEPGGGVISTVSSLALQYNTAGVDVPTVQQIRQELDDNSSKLSDIPSIKSKVDSLVNGPTAQQIADQVRVELTPELTHIMTLESNPGLTPTQATMLLELYNIMGLDPTKPLIVTNTARTAGDISQTIDSNATRTILTRNV